MVRYSKFLPERRLISESEHASAEDESIEIVIVLTTRVTQLKS